MTNSDDGGNLIAEILRSVAKEYSWPDFQPIERVVAKIDPAVLAANVGTYEESNEGVLTVSVKDGRLYLQDTRLGPEPQELLPESDSQFFLSSDDDITFAFQKDAEGAVAKVIIHAGQQTFEAKKVR